MQDPQKLVNLVLYILSKADGSTDLLTIFKTLYFADRAHLAKYGSTITGDRYIAMVNGPVPSNTYDVLKTGRPDSIFSDLYAVYGDFFKIEGRFTVKALREPDVDFFAETELGCLNQSISENVGQGFTALSKKSHQSAYDAANLNAEMDLLKIAEEGNATPAMLEYIRESCELEGLFA